MKYIYIIYIYIYICARFDFVSSTFVLCRFIITRYILVYICLSFPVVLALVFVFAHPPTRPPVGSCFSQKTTRAVVCIDYVMHVCLCFVCPPVSPASDARLGAVYFRAGLAGEGEPAGRLSLLRGVPPRHVRPASHLPGGFNAACRCRRRFLPCAAAHVLVCTYMHPVPYLLSAVTERRSRLETHFPSSGLEEVAHT